MPWPWRLILVLALAWTALPPHTAQGAEPVRTWTSKTGSEVQARLAGIEEGRVVLEREDGTRIRIKLDGLSDLDRRYAIDHAGSNPEMSDGSAPNNPMEICGVFVAPGGRIEFTPPLSTGLQKRAAGKVNPVVTHARVALAVPAEFQPTNTYPMLVISTSSSSDRSSINHMNEYWELATKKGWVVIAADGPVPANDDTRGWRWAMLRAGLHAMHAAWPNSRTWPVAAGGFSGGAKWSGYIGALLAENEYRVIGMFMGGCNEDYATKGLEIYKPKRSDFLRVPIFLSAGMSDTTASVEAAHKVMESMERSHFKNVRLETYNGGHGLDHGHVAAALDWFLAEAAKARNKMPARP